MAETNPSDAQRTSLPDSRIRCEFCTIHDAYISCKDSSNTPGRIPSVWYVLVLVLIDIHYRPHKARLGIHLVIFFLCVRVLLPRRRKIQRVMLGAVVIMFLLATFDVAVSWRLFLRHTPVLYTGTSATFLQAVHPKIIIHLINKSVFPYH
jgi:hypothetical protein